MRARPEPADRIAGEGVDLIAIILEDRCIKVAVRQKINRLTMVGKRHVRIDHCRCPSAVLDLSEFVHRASVRDDQEVSRGVDGHRLDVADTGRCAPLQKRGADWVVFEEPLAVVVIAPQSAARRVHRPNVERAQGRHRGDHCACDIEKVPGVVGGIELAATGCRQTLSRETDRPEHYGRGGIQVDPHELLGVARGECERRGVCAHGDESCRANGQEELGRVHCSCNSPYPEHVSCQ